MQFFYFGPLLKSLSSIFSSSFEKLRVVISRIFNIVNKVVILSKIKPPLVRKLV